MSDNPNFVAGHIINDVIPENGLEFMDQQNLTAKADGTVDLLATKKPEGAAALAPNPALRPIEITALTYAFKRAVMQIQNSGPRKGLGRHKGLNSRGAGWNTSSAKPIKLSKQTMKSLQQINGQNPTATLLPLLHFFKGMENDGVQLNFVRKSDLGVIHQLQYKNNISRLGPRLQPTDKSRRGPQRYAALKMPTSSTEVVRHTIRGNQVKDMANAAGLPRILRVRRYGSDRNPSEYKILNDALKLFAMPEAPKPVKKDNRKNVVKRPKFAGFGPSAGPK